eukprot:CAMPEP_0176489526 /NCGR_PEP_ID=MMETSP0200_2-20121128/7338_1 /TAXON_ID=947934 /ORGANISM="Chaetoceros sp., Strain GSL56" /LENGTH=1134 /DNA_ID=CAMNT_0017886679 /DNA_START=321 /DNA_END=3722 /DNA_ORIENTATION=+
MFFSCLVILTVLSWFNFKIAVQGFTSPSLISSQWIYSQYRTTRSERFISLFPYQNNKVRFHDIDVSRSAAASRDSKSEALLPGSKNRSRQKNYIHNSSNNAELGQAKAINKELIDAGSAQEVLDIFISKGGAKGTAGGNVFNSVNFSTCLHRLARFVNQHDHSHNHKIKKGTQPTIQKTHTVDEKRRSVLSDPRTAILIAALSEAIVENKSNDALLFNNRELANLGWAIAKLKVAPPSNVYPVVRSKSLFQHLDATNETKNNTDIIFSSIEDMHQDILMTAAKVRREVLEVAKERNLLKTPAERAAVKNKWIPTLSQLSGKLLDMIATKVLGMLKDFNSQELANLLYAFASAGRADLLLFESLSDQLVINMQDKSKLNSKDKRLRPKPQEFSNSVWAFASAGLRGDGQVKLIEGVADILDHDNGAIVQDFKPQELSNTAWGVATLLAKRGSEQVPSYKRENQAALRILRWVAKSIEERVEEFKPQEISNSVWAFATVGFGISSSAVQLNTNNEYIYLESDSEEADRVLVSRVLNIVADSSMNRLHRFRPQELNNLAWGICRLGCNGGKMDQLFEGVGQELMKRHSYFKPQDIGTTLWSFATFEYFDEDVYRSAASELTLRKSRSFKPQELSNTVWALATAGVIPQYADAFDTTIIPKAKRPSLSEVTSDPITECFAAATTELMRRPHEFKAQEIKDVLWSLSKASIRHPGVFKRVAEHLVGSDADFENGILGRGMDGFSPQGLGNLAWAYAKQAQLAAAVNESTIGSTGRLAVYETSCLDVGENLVRRLFSRIAETGIENIHRFKPQDLSNTCWAFSTLGLLHNVFFQRVHQEVIGRLLVPRDSQAAVIKFKAQEIANLVWSFATLNVEASSMIEKFTPFIVQMCSNDNGEYTEESIARYIKRQEVANLAWSCAVLGEYPDDLMPLLYTALFGKVCKGDPDYLKKVYGDDGIQKQTIMTMFYVQMALHIEAPDLGLSLPYGFPSGWQESDTRTKRQKVIDNETGSTMLQITTSKLQQNISRTLKKIGFDHRIEHLISTDDLQSEYGISLSSINQEFLSLDIANIDKMIGIEVDGPGHFVNILDGDESDDTASNNIGGVMRIGKGKTGWEFTANSQQKINGPTALKHRLMSHLGW